MKLIKTYESEDFIKPTLRKDNIEAFKKSLIGQFKMAKELKSTIMPPPEWGLFANFYLKLK